MGVTEKGNYKRGQQEQGEDLLGKETNQKSETRSGRWAETGREERRNKLHTKAGMKLRCLEGVIPLLPARHLGKSTSRNVLSLSVLVLTLQKTTVYAAQSRVCCPFCRGLPVADQSSPALLMVGGYHCDATSSALCFFDLLVQKSAQNLVENITNIANSHSSEFRLFA